MTHIGKKEARELIKLAKQVTKEQRLQEQAEREKERIRQEKKENSVGSKVKKFFRRN